MVQGSSLARSSRFLAIQPPLQPSSMLRHLWTMLPLQNTQQVSREVCPYLPGKKYLQQIRTVKLTIACLFLVFQPQRRHITLECPTTTASCRLRLLHLPSIPNRGQGILACLLHLPRLCRPDISNRLSSSSMWRLTKAHWKGRAVCPGLPQPVHTGEATV